VYREYLPVLIGPVLGPYKGYDERVNAQVTQEFSTAAFRVGHSQISEEQTGIDNHGVEVFTQTLADSFFNTASEDLAHGFDPLMRNLSAEPSQATDVYTVPTLRNLLFAPLAGGNVDQVDLIAIDIQRARDVGLNTLNGTRAALQLRPYTSFEQLTSDPVLQAKFQSLYGNIDEVDLFMGGQAEAHAPGAVVGETFQAIIRAQFEALRSGDRFFWRNQQFDAETARSIAGTRLSDILRRNTDSTSVPEQVFVLAGPANRHAVKLRARVGHIDQRGRTGTPFIIR
jgi:peroxidase